MSRRRNSAWFRYLFGKYFDIRLVIEIHGSVGLLDAKGIRDIGVLEHFNEYIKPKLIEEDIIRVAATVLLEFLRRHPFWDGNKRTGLMAATTTLLYGNWVLEIEDEAAERYCRDLAASFESKAFRRVPIDDASLYQSAQEMLLQHSRPIRLRDFTITVLPTFALEALMIILSRLIGSTHPLMRKIETTSRPRGV